MVFGPIWEEFMSPKKHGHAVPDVKTTAFDGDKKPPGKTPYGLFVPNSYHSCKETVYSVK